MDLSVIIVNYNVKHFLEQCLHSVQKAVRNIEAEIFVVDNNSVDGSAELLRDKFPNIILVENKENVGFSKANNQAIKRSSGKYILLLNPDTVVEEDTFEKVIGFMDQHPDAGGLGVKMIDGKGIFLPESKRGLPTPWVAFYKIFGLSRLFPSSKVFGRYHLSFLNEDEIHEIDVLAGAFMLLRRETIEKVGVLDETFFMYGEDIDLSYRIQLAGYKNYYYPETTIIHYKGESTKKGSLNYVKVFYKAMVIFARKHFNARKAGVFSLLIHLAIYFRAFLSVSKRLLSKTIIPLLDAALIFLGFWVLTPTWENLRFHDRHYYPDEFMQYVVPVYIFFFLLGILLSGGYRKPLGLFKLIRGIFWGLIAILLVYSLVDERYRFSRALILLGTVWAGIILVALRLTGHWMKISGFRLDLSRLKRIAIAGHSEEATRVKKILEETRLHSQLAGFIALDKSDRGQFYIGHIDQLQEIIRINRIDELIFCAGNISSAEIIRAMLDLTALNVDYKIAPPESISIIGSNSIHTAGDLYVINLNAISKKVNRRKKRFFDFGFALFFILISPLIIWFFRKKGQFLKNTWQVFTGKKSWIGYMRSEGTFEKLPDLKQGVLNPRDLFPELRLDNEKITRLNMLYAKDYLILTDAEILLKAWQKLDQT